MSSKNKLTAKQERFCEEYMIDLNATQAAIRSGYSKKTAMEQSCRMLSNVKIQKRISQLKDEISKRNNISIDEVVTRISNIARFDLAEVLNSDGSIKNLNEIPEDMREALSGMDIEELFEKGKGKVGEIKKLRTWNKLDALEKLMRHLGGYEKDNVQQVSKVVIGGKPL